MTTTARYDDILRQVEVDLQHLPRRGQAAFFAICGESLRPLYVQFHATTGFGDPNLLLSALAIVRAFVTGGDPTDNDSLQSSLLAITPHGDDFDSPGSTFAQDVTICIDVAVRCSIIVGECNTSCLGYALEPLMSALTQRRYGVLQLGSGSEEEEWQYGVVNEPEMARALRFCIDTINILARIDIVSPELFDQLLAEASVLRPAVVEAMLLI